MNMQGQENTLVIKPRSALYVFGGAGIVVVILSFISQYIRLFPQSYDIHYPIQADLIHDFILEFNFMGSSNISVYYNVLILNVAACLLFVVAYFKSINKGIHRFQWTIMAWVVLFFAIDNLADVLKKIQAFFQNKTSSGGWSDYVWVVAGFVILAIIFLQFSLHLDNKYRSLFLVSLALYFAGILGKEVTSFYNQKQFIYALYLTLAQVLQYGGVTLLIYSLLHYITSFFPKMIIESSGR